MCRAVDLWLPEVDPEEACKFSGAIDRPSLYCVYLVNGLDGDKGAQRDFEHHLQGCLYCQDVWVSRFGKPKIV